MNLEASTSPKKYYASATLTKIIQEYQNFSFIPSIQNNVKELMIELEKLEDLHGLVSGSKLLEVVNNAELLLGFVKNPSNDNINCDIISNELFQLWFFMPILLPTLRQKSLNDHLADFENIEKVIISLNSWTTNKFIIMIQLLVLSNLSQPLLLQHTRFLLETVTCSNNIDSHNLKSRYGLVSNFMDSVKKIRKELILHTNEMRKSALLLGEISKLSKSVPKFFQDCSYVAFLRFNHDLISFIADSIRFVEMLESKGNINWDIQLNSHMNGV